MARIIIFGGHGKVALRAARILTGHGVSVTSVIRNPDHAGEVADAEAIPVVADVAALDTDEIAALITGHDVVVWSAGAGGGDPARTRAVDRDAAVRSMDAAELAGARRYVMVSYFGSRLEHRVDPENSFFAYAQAKAEADAHLRGTSLDWTILGPSTLTDDAGTGRIDAAVVTGEQPSAEELDDGAPQPTQVSRDNVAAVIAAVVADDAVARGTVARTVLFDDGETSISEALAA